MTTTRTAQETFYLIEVSGKNLEEVTHEAYGISAFVADSDSDVTTSITGPFVRVVEVEE